METLFSCKQKLEELLKSEGFLLPIDLKKVEDKYLQYFRDNFDKYKDDVLVQLLVYY